MANATTTRPEPAFAANNLDAMRALAVLAVFAHHAEVLMGAASPFFGPDGGWFGIQLFFVISGYLISRSWERHAPRDYVRHRALRILPAYLVFFILVGAWKGLVTWEALQAHPDRILANLLVMQHLHPASIIEMDVLRASWTLTIEVLWYASVPLVIPLMRRAPWATTGAIAVVSTLWAAFAVDAIGPLYPADLRASHPYFGFFFIANAFPAQLVFFALGALVHLRPGLIRIHPLLLVAAVVFTLLYPQFGDWRNAVSPNGLTGIGICALMLLALGAPPTRSRLIRWLSDVSYSFYLLHMIAIESTVARFDLYGVPGAGLALAMTLVFASLGHILIEQPMMRLARAPGRLATLVPTPLATIAFWFRADPAPSARPPFPAVGVRRPISERRGTAS